MKLFHKAPVIKISLSILLASLFVMQAHSKGDQPKKQVPATKAPTETTKPNNNYSGKLNPKTLAEWDFGFVPIGYDMVYTTLLQNIGKDSLQLLDIVSTCECTIPKLGRDIIPPDSSTPLTITFNTEKFSGPQSRFVEIHSTDPYASERLLQFKAIVSGRPAEVALLPNSMLILSGQKGDSLVVKNYTSDDIPFKEAFINSELFELQAEFNYIPGDGYTHYYLKAKEGIPIGEHYSTLTLEFETDPPARISMPIKIIRR